MSAVTDELVEHDYVVDALRHAIADGEAGLSAAPKALKRLVETDAWRKRTIVRTGEVVEFDSFRVFVTTPPLEGLGTTVEVLRAVCRDDPAVLKMLDEPLSAPGGKREPKQVDNVNLKGGNSEDYTRRRLRRDRPDLYDEVIAGSLSANAAAQQAGFRPATATIRVDTASNAVRGLLRRFTRDEILEALKDSDG